eukprot:251567-Pleurochrysis_carterae.AAC.1
MPAALRRRTEVAWVRLLPLYAATGSALICAELRLGHCSRVARKELHRRTRTKTSRSGEVFPCGPTRIPAGVM